jgi:hypothetical protein
VVLINHLGQRPGRFDILEKLVAFNGMFFNQGKLEIGQFGRLGQDLRRDRELADVVDGTGHVDAFDLFGGKYQLGGNGARQVRRPELMTGGIGIGCFHGGYHDLDDRVDCLPETVQGILDSLLRQLNVCNILWNNSNLLYFRVCVPAADRAEGPEEILLVPLAFVLQGEGMARYTHFIDAFCKPLG